MCPFTSLLHVAMQMGLYLHRRKVGVWRVVSEDSSNYLPNWPFSLFAFQIHLIGLLNDLDQSMAIKMSFAFHRHHDLAKELKVTFLTGERHVAFVERKHSLNNQTTTYDRIDQYIFVPMFWSDPPCIEYASRKFEQTPPDFVLIDEEFRIYQITKSGRFVLFDRYAKTTFAFDQSRKEPTSLFAV